MKIAKELRHWENKTLYQFNYPVFQESCYSIFYDNMPPHNKLWTWIRIDGKKHKIHYMPSKPGIHIVILKVTFLAEFLILSNGEVIKL